MIRVAVTGAAGRMGREIIRVVSETEGVTLAGAVERPGHPAVGEDAGNVGGLGSLGVRIAQGLEAVLPTSEVVIDFTTPAASLEHAEAVRQAGRAIVIGSTGFTAEQKEAVRRTSVGARVFLAPNMSVGVNVLFKVVGDVARLLGDGYDVEILETHHRFKKDAPSGTALGLAEAVARALGRDLDADAVYGRRGMPGERRSNEIGIHAIRSGDVVGDHTVLFGGLGERIEITHKASSRETFARGAVRAAAWLPSQPPGLYDMMDLLGLR
ncbi:MAG: 4-hydroxy-tetrahydrodipicolinate reductase [Deltaproteobacteria bacterium]|nr:4-hydroxy-tetrahydrodipicolinate reductase [Deltaproteobacteria bacterium]